MTNSTAARTVLKFRWLFVTLVLAFAIYLGQFDFLLEPKALPYVPPASTYSKYQIYIQHFDTRAEAEQVCGKNNIAGVEEITPTESKDAGYTCRDWDDQGPMW